LLSKVAPSLVDKYSTMEKLKLVRPNLGRVFNFRYGSLFAMSISFRTTKLPSLKWKNQPKTPLGYLPLAFEPLDTTILKMRAGEKG
jgi:hypothetical protein